MKEEQRTFQAERTACAKVPGRGGPHEEWREADVAGKQKLRDE